MKARNKYVLEGAIVELVHDEYDRLLSIDDMMSNIDSQKYLGGVTAEEADQCLDVLKRVKELYPYMEDIEYKVGIYEQ